MGRRICCLKLGTTARRFAKTPSRGCQCCYRHTQSSSGTRYAPATKFDASAATAKLSSPFTPLTCTPFNLFMQLGHVLKYNDML